jgi:quinol monooxygenase YgiN
MKSLIAAVFGANLVLAAVTGARAGEAPAAPVGPIHVTAYVEVTPPSTGQMVDIVKQYRDAARGEPGAMTIELYQEVGMPSRLVTREIWSDQAAADAHSKAASTTALQGKLKPIQYGPVDYRAHDVYINAGPGGPAGNAPVVIVSHLDVTPNVLPQLLAAMKPLGDGTAKEAGLVTYQILRQTAGARNHFRLFEIWTNEQAWESHNLASHTQTFRDALYPMLGTPYDQRKYQLVN